MVETQMTVGILVPTLNRPELIGPLAKNIADTTPLGDFELIFVLDHADEKSRIEVIKAKHCRFVLCDGTYPIKTNAAFKSSVADLILPTADDVWFREGWLDAVTARFNSPDVHVVGTDDTTPVTADHAHSTMPVIRRSYVENPGCSWHLPGLVFWDGYHHNFVETEVCQLAQHRGCWDFAPDAVIEHRHPAWGTRDEDATDDKGNKQGFESDGLLFERRKAEWSRS